MLSFEWDVNKAETNRQEHGISFELAKKVFDDPNVLFRRDYYLGELRDQAIGVVESSTLLFVVHTVIYETEDATRIRIISARVAGRREQRLYRDTHS